MFLISKTCRLETNRLLVREWHSFSLDDPDIQDLAKIVSSMLTKSVTRSLREGWRGAYTVKRANEWISQRDHEGTTLLVLEGSSRKPVGLMILLESDDELARRTIRLGYLLSESVWGQGLASELVHAFVSWCRTAAITLIVAGVGHENIPSQRVLEKNGFVRNLNVKNEAELIFELKI